MSLTRIICEGCGFALAWCSCKTHVMVKRDRLERAADKLDTFLDECNLDDDRWASDELKVLREEVRQAARSGK